MKFACYVKTTLNILCYSCIFQSSQCIFKMHPETESKIERLLWIFLNISALFSTVLEHCMVTKIPGESLRHHVQQFISHA